MHCKQGTNCHAIACVCTCPGCSETRLPAGAYLKADQGDVQGNALSRYARMGLEIGKLLDEKQAAYGDINKTNALLKMLYPEGIPPEKMDDALLITRILDKVNRIATDRDAFGESPFRDIAGYAILGAVRIEDKKAEKGVKP